MFNHRWSSGHDVGIILDDVVCVGAHDAIHQRREPVQMIEILEQTEPVNLGEILVGFAQRDAGSDFDRDLFEPDRGFEW